MPQQPPKGFAQPAGCREGGLLGGQEGPVREPQGFHSKGQLQGHQEAEGGEAACPPTLREITPTCHTQQGSPTLSRAHSPLACHPHPELPPPDRQQRINPEKEKKETLKDGEQQDGNRCTVRASRPERFCDGTGLDWSPLARPRRAAPRLPTNRRDHKDPAGVSMVVRAPYVASQTCNIGTPTCGRPWG